MVCKEDLRSATAGFPHLPSKQEDAVAVSLLEIAADNDVEAFRSAVERGARVDQPEDWYVRQIGKNQMAVQQRTPIMVASLFGSIEVLRYILSVYDSMKFDINLANGSDGLSALHCAAAGGSANADETVKLLLNHGADVSVNDACSRKPCDVLMVSPKLSHKKGVIEAMLRDGKFSDAIVDKGNTQISKALDEKRNLKFSDAIVGKENTQMSRALDEKRNLSSLIPTEENDVENFASEFFCKMDGLTSACSSDSFSSLGSSSPPFSPVSPSSPKFPENHSEKGSADTLKKPKGYSTDVSLPDIKNSIYTTDEFRMFSFKIRPCSRAYSHDWTECPFVHPGENARRRDPRRYHYSCVPCPDFRKGACRRGDACEYAHGVFECWLHPAQYRTRLCKDGTSCTRRVCFFAHTTEELRPLYASTGSALSSPRASPAFDARSMSPPLNSFSAPSMLMAPAFSPSSRSGTTPPLSPSASSLRASLGGSWSPPNVPALHLPSGGLHGSRLRAAFSARDIPLEEFDVSDCDPSMDSDLLLQFNQTTPISSSGAGNQGGRMGKYCNLALDIPSSNFPDLITSEINSPRTNLLNDLALASPKIHHKMQSALQLQMNALLSPRFQNMSHVQEHGFSRAEKHAKQMEYFDTVSHPPISSFPHIEFESPSSPAASRLSDPPPGFSSLKSAFHLKENKGSWSSKSLSGTASSASWSDWGSPSGKPDWGIQGHDFRKLQKTSSLVSHGEMEPDLSWVQSLVKDGPADIEKVGLDCFVGNVSDDLKNGVGDLLLDPWIERTHKNQVVA